MIYIRNSNTITQVVVLVVSMIKLRAQIDIWKNITEIELNDLHFMC